jgi:hypothetical protein
MRLTTTVLLVGLLAVARAGDPEPAPPPLELVQTIALPGVKGRMDHFALDRNADNVRYDEATQRVYVGFGEGGIAALSAKKPRALAQSDIGAHPESFQLETAGRRLFVNSAATAVVELDRFDLTVKRRFALGGPAANFPMALDEPAARLLVGCRAPPTIVTLATDDGRVVSRTECAGDPDDLFVDAKRGRVYVACGAGVVDVFSRPSPDRLERLAKVETRKGARTCLFDAALDRLFVAVPQDGDKDAEIRVYAPK